jgi:ribosomal protein L11 methyltransferase
LIRLAVRCSKDAAELVLAELLVLAPGGVEEERGPDWVEYAIYGSPGELPDLGEIDAVAGDERIEVTSEEIPDDWADRWRDFHEPVLIAERVLVRPSWADPVGADAGAQEDAHGVAVGQAFGAGEEQPTGVVQVVIDPGQAFGTGAHPTTRLSIEFLAELAAEGKAHGTVADLGTGSGVLAIAAAKLGWGPVLGVDSEAAALEAAGENARLNGVELELVRANVREEVPPLAETVVANLTAPLLREIAARMSPREDWTPRLMVCSGLLTREADDIAAAFETRWLKVRSKRESGDWAAFLLERVAE